MARKTQQESAPLKEKAATVIALNILKWKAGLAINLNNWANQYSGRQQRWLLAVFSVIFGSGLIVCLVLPYGRTAMNGPGNYQPMHIGSPSERPKPASRSNDSLTIKK